MKRLRTALFSMMLIFPIAGCVIMDSNSDASPEPKSSVKLPSTPLRLNVRIALDCTPTCAFVGTDLGQVSKSIIAAYQSSGRFAVVPSDQVDFDADIKLNIDRQSVLLDAGICNRTCGLIPAIWHDTVRMSTTFTRRQGGPAWHAAQAAEVDYRCHLFLAPLSPFWSDPDVLDRRVAELSLATVARGDAERVWDPNTTKASSGK